MKKLIPRPYQEECVEVIDNLTPGSYLIVMATGLGKTYTMSLIHRQGRMLIISHREELVNQPEQYFDCTFGIELREQKSNGEEVISASTQTLTANKRYLKFAPDEFDIIIVDEAHHSAAKTYRELINYFKPRLLLGFTATPNRGDGVRLDDIYQAIVYDKDIRWGISNNYLSNVECLRADIGYDLRSVRVRNGDYKISELAAALQNTEDAIIEVYNELHKGATLIFTVTVEQAEKISRGIPNSVVVSADTKNRDEIIERFTNREIDCIVNCMVFTEGTDIPLCETVIIARPTKSNTLYTQMVGRGLRLHQGKDKLRLIDCVGQSEKHSICTAPSLLGIDTSSLTDKQKERIQGNLLDLPDMVLFESDCPVAWIRSVERIDLWAAENEYDLRGVNWIQLPDGSLTITMPKNEELGRERSEEFVLPAPDELGNTKINGMSQKMQKALDLYYGIFNTRFKDVERVWNIEIAQNTWGKELATKKQKDIIRRSDENLEGLDFDKLTKFQASLIITRLFSDRARMFNPNASHNNRNKNNNRQRSYNNSYCRNQRSRSYKKNSSGTSYNKGYYGKSRDNYSNNNNQYRNSQSSSGNNNQRSYNNNNAVGNNGGQQHRGSGYYHKGKSNYHSDGKKSYSYDKKKNSTQKDEDLKTYAKSLTDDEINTVDNEKLRELLKNLKNSL